MRKFKVGSFFLITSLMILLTACQTNTSIKASPQVQMQNQITGMESQITQAEQSNLLNLAASTAKEPGSWEFFGKKAVSISGSTALEINLYPSLDQDVHLQVQNNADAVIKSALSQEALALNIQTKNPVKVKVYLPTQTQYLKLEGMTGVFAQGLNHIIYLNLKNCNQVNFDIQNWMLEFLILDQDRNVQLANLNTPYLLADIHNTNQVKLLGHMNLRELKVDHTENLQAYWLNSPILNLTLADNSHVFLAGKVTMLNATLKNHAQLSAEYLRTDRVFVNTHQTAVAKVAPLTTLNALAEDDSRIYYYHQPQILSRYYHGDGSILYMGDMVPPCHLAFCLTTMRFVPG